MSVPTSGGTGWFTYAHDAARRLVGLTNPNGGTASWSYLANNWLQQQTLGTEIRVTAEHIAVRNYPLRRPKDFVVPIALVDRLFCVEQYAVSRSGVQTFYDFKVLLKQGKNLRPTLVPSMDDYEHALFLQQQIEQRLGIIHHPVPGEFKLLSYQREHNR